MTDDTALLFRALNALTYYRQQTRPIEVADRVIAALHDRLEGSKPAETQSEPVAWAVYTDCLMKIFNSEDNAVRWHRAETSYGSNYAYKVVPLYSSPQPQSTEPSQHTPQQRVPLSDSDLLRLARRCLWLAYVWNDHNFPDPPHKYAQDEAKALGIDSFKDANEWLGATYAAITKEPT